LVAPGISAKKETGNNDYSDTMESVEGDGRFAEAPVLGF
jgi:hypothetical protein